MARFSDPEQWQRLPRVRRAELIAHQIESGWWSEWAHRDLDKQKETGAAKENPARSILGFLHGKKR